MKMIGLLLGANTVRFMVSCIRFGRWPRIYVGKLRLSRFGRRCRSLRRSRLGCGQGPTRICLWEWL